PTDEILSLTRQQIGTLRKIREGIVRDVSIFEATYDTVIRPLADAQHDIQHSVGVIEMLLYAAPEAETREVAQIALGLWNKYFTEFNGCHGLYVIAKVVKDRDETLDKECTRYLDRMLAGFIRCGHGRLNPKQIVQYVQRANTIDDLCDEFTRNVRNASSGIWLSNTELEVVPEPDLIAFRTAAEELGTSGQSKVASNSKEFFVALSQHNVLAVLQYAKSPGVRKRMYIANRSKLPEHLALFKDIILLRDTNARQLGYKSHAAFRLEQTLAKTTSWVYDFMDQLENDLLPRGKREIQQLLALKAKDFPVQESVTNTIDVWDFQYWKRRALEGLEIDQDELAEYFPLKQVVGKMLKLFSDCLLMRFERTSAQVWHPDVEAWEVWDDRPGRDQEFIGYLYMDLTFRYGKHRGCQNVNIQSSYIDSTNTRVYPSTLLMCNFSPTRFRGSDSIVLLKHSQIVSLFHGS
ncbi:zincin, partial [Aureobasidium sp. EXF-8845]